MSDKNDEGKSAEKAPKYKAPEGSKADFTIKLV